MDMRDKLDESSPTRSMGSGSGSSAGVDVLPDFIGPYKVVERLGRGGMGVVYKATDLMLNRTVAIKILGRWLTNDDACRKRFLREAQAVAAIDHPHVVAIHRIDEHDGVPYLVMEYIDGSSLQEIIRTTASRDLNWVLRISRQIAQGLQAAHTAGVIHRDIKPSNVLIDRRLQAAHIVDFGLAYIPNLEESLTGEGQFVGTPAYMSPEQVLGQQVDQRSDLFSLGCLIYAMVSGRSPFKGPSMAAIARQISDETPALLSSTTLHVSEGLSQICEKLLSKNADARFQSAAAVDEVLAACERQLGLDESVPGGTTRIASSLPAPQGTMLMWLLGGACILLLAVCSGSTGWWLDSQQARPINTLETVPEVSPESSPVVAPPVPPDANGPRRWTVAQDASLNADGNDLGRVLGRVGPGDTIEVLDDAVYRGALELHDRHRLEGVSIISTRRATIESASLGGQMATVSLANTPNVRIQGFRIKTDGLQHSLMLKGELTGVVLDDLELIQPDDASWANILIYRQAHGSPEHPLEIRNCRFHSSKYGLYVGREEYPAEPQALHIAVRNNHFDGPAVHVLLLQAVEDLRFEQNLFTGGDGFWIVLNGTSPTSAIRISNNTFFRTHHWLGFGDDRTDYHGTAFNNLILESKTTEILGNWQHRTTPWWVHHNVWESRDKLQLSLPPEMLTVITDAEILSRDTQSEDFLKPKPGGFAADGGAAGDSPPFLGAFSPSTRSK